MIRYHQVRAADRRLRRLLRKHERTDRQRMQATYDRVLREGVRRRIEVTSTAGLAYEKWKDPLACLMIEGDGVAYPYEVIDETTVEVAWMVAADLDATE